MHRDERGIWIIRLNLCSGHDHDFKAIFDHMKIQYGQDETDLISFGNVLAQIGKFAEAEKYYYRILNILPPDHIDISTCYYSLGNVADDQGNYESSLEWHNKSLNIKLQTLQPDDPSIALSLNSIGAVYCKKK